MATDYKYSPALQHRQRMKIDEMFSQVFGYPWIFSPIIVERVGEDNREKPNENVRKLFIGRDILDIGSGDGYLEQRLLEYSPESIVAIDIDVDMMNKAKQGIETLKKWGRYGEVNVELIRDDVKGVHFEDGRFDYVFVLSTLGELIGKDGKRDAQEELHRVLERVRRLIKDHGLLFLEYEEDTTPDAKDVEGWVKGNFRNYDKYSSSIGPGYPTIIGKIPYSLLICTK